MMAKFPLGQTGLEVSQLCFGALPMGPLQRNMPPERGGQVIAKALDLGVNFIDTAQVYETYEHIRQGILGRPRPIIASKSFAENYEDMAAAIEEALTALDVDYIDIFHLHAPRCGTDFARERAGALKCLLDHKEQGLIKAVGISTHTIAAVKAAAQRDDIDVIYPIINFKGLGILDGTAEEMAQAIAEAAQKGKGLYAMKVFGGGNLLDQKERALEFVFNIPGLDVISIGMVHEREVEMNLRLLAGERVAPDSPYYVPLEEKELFISRFCTACGNCVDTCPNHALEIVEDRAQVDKDSCLLCGYCSPVCPQFAIRLV
jgi:predicted aldo/keto reductase-like oxidoreductase